ncbi:hypothetical protein PAXRUDRAFT_165864 [Paxillus rubicundulus Ve08.2h10]|uniref:Restriction of telomere capping protein 4 n=1 Tax=Paxillus rubicundulus Ve08.2h10 TaxID=930991 RepID=A0A0D0DAX8_9AGAM|nr:hypothetical protein PAXRUDRAFT_165864 [Paxillus rubicundulus Ve08.2h10]
MPFGIVCSPEWKDGVRKLAMQYLNTSCMLTQQKDKLLVEKVIRKAQVQWPDLVPYEGGWAVRDILAQFLRNRSGKEREMEKDMQTSTSRQQSKRKAKDTSDLDSCNEDLKARTSTPCHKKKKLRTSSSQQDHDDDSDLESGEKDSDQHKKQGKQLEPKGRRPPNQKANHCKMARVVLSDDKGDAENKADVDVEMEEMEPITGLSDLDSSDDEAHDSPGTRRCPGPSCTHKIPSNIHPRLASALTKYDKLHQEKGRDYTIRLRMDICIMVKNEYEKLTAIGFAAERGWPATSINFKKIPDHIIVMSEELRNLVFNSKAREKGYIWTSFEGDLETTPIDTFRPLSHHQLLTYFLIPHIAATLIAQDLNNTTIANGYKAMIASNQVGMRINTEEDDDLELDKIYHRNVVLFKKQKTRTSFQGDTPTGTEVQDAASALLKLKGGEVCVQCNHVFYLILILYMGTSLMLLDLGHE